MPEPTAFVKGIAACGFCGSRIVFHVPREGAPNVGFGRGEVVYCFRCDPIFPPFLPTETIESDEGDHVFLIEFNTGREPSSAAIYEWFFEL